MATATLRAVLEGFDQAVRQLSEVASGQQKVADANAKVGDSANDATKPLKDMMNVSESLGTIMKGVLVVGATAATAAIADLGYKATESVKNLTELGDQVNRLAQITGVGASALTSYSLAFQTNNVSLEEGARALEQFGKRLFEAQQGNTQAGRAFQALGIDVKQFGGDTEAAMLAVADKFATLKDGAGKTALAIELGGRTFAAMIPVLNEGSAGLRKFQDEARRAGIVMTDETAKAASELSASLTVLGAYSKGFWQEFATPLVTGLADVARNMRDARDAGAGFFSMLLTGAQSLARVSLFGTEKGQQNDAASQLSQLGLKLGTQNAALSALDGRDDAFATITRQRILQEQAGTQAQINQQYATYQRLEAFINPLGNQPKADAPNLDPRATSGGGKSAQQVSDQFAEHYAKTYGQLQKLGQISEEDYAARLEDLSHNEALSYQTRTDMALKANDVRLAIAKELASQQITLLKSQEQAEADGTKAYVEEEKKRTANAEYQNKARERLDAEHAKDQRDLNEYVSKTNTDAAEKQIRDINSVVEVERGDHLRALQAVAEQYRLLGPAGDEAYKKVQTAVADATREQQKTLQSVFQIKSGLGQLALDIPAIFATVPKSLQQNYAEILKGHESLMDGLKNIWRSFGDAVINEFSRIAANATVSLVMNMLGAGGGGGSGIGGGIASGAASGATSSLFGGSGGSIIGSLAAKFGLTGGSGFSSAALADGTIGGGSAAGAAAGSSAGLSSFAAAAPPIAAALFAINDYYSSRDNDPNSLRIQAALGSGQYDFQYDNEGQITGSFVNTSTGAVVNGIPPGFATGTDSIFSKPTMIRVGENGPERVQVTPSAAMGSGRGGGVTVNVSGMSMLDIYSARRMARELKRMAAA